MVYQKDELFTRKQKHKSNKNTDDALQEIGEFLFYDRDI